MLTISKPLAAAQVQTYHREEFANAKENYYTEGDRIVGQWHGKLAEEWGLKGDVADDHFKRLSEGQHPTTGEQLVRHQTPREYTNSRGDLVKSVDHRAGWDATFSAPKSVSVTALVGGDERVIEAHRAAVGVALDEVEKYVQARMGGNRPAITTGRWVAARFEHDSSRPVDGYAAPQLHTHTVFFNMTELPDGQTRALQPRELYKTQQYGTAVYRSELALRLKELGYEIEIGKSGAPEINGYSEEYIAASSPRSQQIKEHLEERGLSGAGPAQIAAHQTRDEKLTLSRDEVKQQHQEMAAAHGHQPQRVVSEAQERAHEVRPYEPNREAIESAITHARDRNIERQAVSHERELMRDALKGSMGEASLEDVRQRFDARVEAGELVQVETDHPGRAFTTPEMQEMERDVIHAMREGQDKYEPLASEATRARIENEYGHLNEGQRAAVAEVLSSRDQITGLDGVAGAGKTTSLEAIRDAAAREGYEVRGLAPTSGAARKLEEAGIESSTLQKHLARGDEHNGTKHLYVVDESSLASTKQVDDVVKRLGGEDRVLFVGDTRQHQAVEAGTPYQQLQDAGMRTARLEEIVRQQDPALRQAVEQLADGRVREAVRNLDTQGRVHEIPDREERLTAIAREYARQPEGTLIVSPDNESRREINGLVREEMRAHGHVGAEEHAVNVLSPRQEVTGADRAVASEYKVGDVVRYSKGSEVLDLKPGEYVRVADVDKGHNVITVEKSSGQETTYDPRRLQGVGVYRESELKVSDGDRVQFTAPSKDLGVVNRELGTVEKIEPSGDMTIRMDSGRTVDFNVKEHPHLDHGYAMTSYSSQGQTADRVLVHVDTDKSADLVNSRMGYVAISRGSEDVQVFTNDKSGLGEALSREVSHSSALTEGVVSGAAEKTVGNVGGKTVENIAEKAAATAIEAPAVVVAAAKTAVNVVASKVKEMTIDQGQEM
jgi:conjugative relaxase-like TrwC/TraI family protein